MDMSVRDPSDTRPPALDFSARTRIEEVATALVDLMGRLETRIDRQDARIAELELALEEMGMTEGQR